MPLQLTSQQQKEIEQNINFNFSVAEIIEQADEFILYDAPHVSLMVYNKNKIDLAEAQLFASTISNNFNVLFWEY